MRFSPSSCGSGKKLGFYGVQLADAQGRRLRVTKGIDGTFEAVYFPSGSQVGEKLGACGTLTLDGDMEMDYVRSGTATLACESERRRVSGAVTFELCR
jgi:hypothetical protein